MVLVNNLDQLFPDLKFQCLVTLYTTIYTPTIPRLYSNSTSNMRPEKSTKLNGRLSVKTIAAMVFQVTPRSPIEVKRCTIAVAPAATIFYKWVTLAVELLRVPTGRLPNVTNQVLLGSFELSHDANLLHNNLINGIFDEFMKNLFKFVDGNQFVDGNH